MDSLVAVESDPVELPEPQERRQNQQRQDGEAAIDQHVRMVAGLGPAVRRGGDTARPNLSGCHQIYAGPR
jgi:hypothetical protein